MLSGIINRLSNDFIKWMPTGTRQRLNSIKKMKAYIRGINEEVNIPFFIITGRTDKEKIIDLNFKLMLWR